MVYQVDANHCGLDLYFVILNSAKLNNLWLKDFKFQKYPRLENRFIWIGLKNLYQKSLFEIVNFLTCPN